MNTIGSTLKALRKKSGLSADDVLSKLRERNIVISAKTLYGYENDMSIRSSTFLALCEIYSVSDIIGTFLSSIPKSPNNWEDTFYEDYFNGRTVNEKYQILQRLGIPSFDGMEAECSSDVFFGNQPSGNSSSLVLSDLEKKIVTRLHQLSEEQQRAFLLILSGSDTSAL